MLKFNKLVVLSFLSIYIAGAQADPSVKKFVDVFWLMDAPYVTIRHNDFVPDYSKIPDSRATERLSKAGKNIWPLNLNVTDDEHNSAVKRAAKVGILEARQGLRFEERSTGGRMPTYYMRIRSDHCGSHHWLKHIKREDSFYTQARLKELPAAKILYNYCMEMAHMAVVANPHLRNKVQP